MEEWPCLKTFGAYFCCKLSRMDFLCSQVYTHKWLCDFWPCSQRWWSNLHKGQHTFHPGMPSSRHTQDQRDIHTACISHKGFLCSLACTCKLLCGFWHYIQRSGHTFQMCKGPNILYCNRLLWWGIHRQTYTQLCWEWKKEELLFCSHPIKNHNKLTFFTNLMGVSNKSRSTDAYGAMVLDLTLCPNPTGQCKAWVLTFLIYACKMRRAVRVNQAFWLRSWKGKFHASKESLDLMCCKLWSGCVEHSTVPYLLWTLFIPFF